MPSVKRVVLALAFASFATALGCAGARPPSESPLAAGDTRPASFVAKLAEDGATRRALRGVAKIAIDGPNGSGRAKQIVALERPAKLRVEVLGLLDQTIALLTTDGVSYRFVRSADRSVERGAVRDGLLAEIAGVALAPEDAVRLLLAAPVEPGARVLSGAALSDGGVRAVIASESGFERAALDFDADALLRRWALLGADGEIRIEARFRDWRDAGGRAFPYEIEIDDAVGGGRAALSWSSVELDPALDPALFAVPLP